MRTSVARREPGGAGRDLGAIADSRIHVRYHKKPQRVAEEDYLTFKGSLISLLESK